MSAAGRVCRARCECGLISQFVGSGKFAFRFEEVRDAFDIIGGLDAQFESVSATPNASAKVCAIAFQTCAFITPSERGDWLSAMFCARIRLHVVAEGRLRKYLVDQPRAARTPPAREGGARSSAVRARARDRPGAAAARTARARRSARVARRRS